jgi:hypothetical protein
LGFLPVRILLGRYTDDPCWVVAPRTNDGDQRFWNVNNFKAEFIRGLSPKLGTAGQFSLNSTRSGLVFRVVRGVFGELKAVSSRATKGERS